VIWDGTFDGRAAERNFTVSKLQQHIAEVRSEIDENRLLVFDVKEGWESLCRFLGHPIPQAPFPRTNRRSTVRAAVRLITFAKYLLIALLAAAAVALLVVP